MVKFTGNDDNSQQRLLESPAVVFRPVQLLGSPFLSRSRAFRFVQCAGRQVCEAADGEIREVVDNGAK